jgi:hypothetical protein
MVRDGLPPVPTGLQTLVRMAALDAAFLDQLLDRRADAAAAAGIELSPSERAILAALPREQLIGMARSVPAPPPDRRQFLAGAAAAAAALLLGSACGEHRPVGKPVPQPPDAAPPPDASPPRPAESHPTRGIVHDLPGSRPTINNTTMTGGSAPDVPEPRPERTTPSGGGHAPDHP